MLEDWKTARIRTRYIADAQLLVVTVSGRYSLSDNTELIEDCIAEIVEKKCVRCLFDWREADLSVGVVTAMNRSELYESLGLARTVKVAGVFREVDRDIHFAETVFLNRGWQMRAFTSEEEAMAWLMAD